MWPWAVPGEPGHRGSVSVKAVGQADPKGYEGNLKIASDPAKQ